MPELYTSGELGELNSGRNARGLITGTIKKVAIVTFFFFGVALIAPLIMLLRMLRNRRLRFLIIAAGVYALGLSGNAWLFPHYLAPFAGALYVLLLQCMRPLRVWRPGGQPSGLFLVRVIPVMCLILASIEVCAKPLNVTINRWPAMWHGTERAGLARARISKELESFPGGQL